MKKICLLWLIACLMFVSTANASYLIGLGVPDISIGSTGDFYGDETTGRYYGPKTATGWASSFGLSDGMFPVLLSTLWIPSTSTSAIGISGSLSLTPSPLGPGTISNVAGSTSVVGTGTTFTTTFVANDQFTIPTSGGKVNTGQQTLTIASIQNDTHLTTTAAITKGYSNVQYDAIAFNGIGPYDSTPLYILGTTNTFFQGSILNKSNGACAQAGWTATNDTGTDIAGFMWAGINSSAFNCATAYNIGGASDVSIMGYTAGHDVYYGNMAATGSVYFASGGTAAANRWLSMSNAGAFTFLNGASMALQATTITETNLLVSNAAPTYGSGFGTLPSIATNNGTAAFTVNVGTGGSATSGVINMPTATTGWICNVNDRTAAAAHVAYNTRQTATTVSSVTVENQTTSTGAAVAWGSGDIITLSCFGY